ncbi:hypothetical protein AM592_03705 [Bacillus gobiensis]|uniref:Uncharacterized protein n=1 Tax=Bacillus gobiensis TaxID=1441095 RepID=A0A0M4FHZ9_9BACI|nr:hypothetical protein AM592_03705 [Bacillus gobiensis]
MREQEKENLGDAWEGGNHQFVFHSGTGKPYYFTTPTSKWSKFAKKLDLKYIRLHNLRHIMVNPLIEEGAKNECNTEKNWACKFKSSFRYI